MKKEVIDILRGLHIDVNINAEIEDLRWAEAHGNAVNWAAWYEAFNVLTERQNEVERNKELVLRKNVARAHKLVNDGIGKDAGIRVLTRACAALRDEAFLGYTGWDTMDDLKAALYAESVDAADPTTWPAWVESLMYDLTPEWSGHVDVGGAHAALRASVEVLFPFDSNSNEPDEPAGLISVHKGRRW